MESSSLQELEQIPGVGKTIAQDMQNIGIHSIDDLKGRQAEQLYDRLCEFKASPACPELACGEPACPECNRRVEPVEWVDRCMLYVFNWLYTIY